MRKNLAFYALIYCALVLTMMDYYLIPPRFEAAWMGFGPGQWVTPTLTGGLGWVISCWIGFVILPMILIRGCDEQIKDFGFKTTDLFKHLKIYLGLFVLMTPVIYFVSQQSSFLDVYPFVPEAKNSWGNFLIWEISYISQFFCLEFFFRGFLLYSVEKKSDHWVAIAVMVVPYTMVHFHKPMIEAIGAVIAGVVLGHLSLKYRSWLGGAILHSLVAVSMDSLAAFGTGSKLW